MRIKTVSPGMANILHVVAEDGTAGDFDVTPYLESEAFEPLRQPEEFKKLHNGGYFIEWDCGADLSSDTIEAHWKPYQETAEQSA
jgi:hypothetical protein